MEATTEHQGQKPGQPARGSEPTSTEGPPPTAWTAATSCLRSCPWWPQTGALPFSNNVTESPAIGGPHTLLCSLLPDSILTEWEEPLPPPYQLPASSVAFPNFYGAHQWKLQPQMPQVHPESSAWVPVLPWTSPPTGHTYASKAEPVIFPFRVTLPFVTPPALRGWEARATASRPYPLHLSANFVNFTSHTFLKLSLQNSEIGPQL